MLYSNHLARTPSICDIVTMWRDMFYGLIIIFAQHPRLLNGGLVHYHHHVFSIIINFSQHPRLVGGGLFNAPSTLPSGPADVSPQCCQL